ncbi:hypothetical protein C1H87_12940 [Flavivirga eckloniae]|uniref:TonB-dependent receptor plug domain-containing protein n=1 Tax=Flavivirga eckloniae TaxID=1803846 RepID=A0A2K9PXQ8_9FLAO|nr:hypothetical protein C1H87_12940 [Flavivirga eckloniae]
MSKYNDHLFVIDGYVSTKDKVKNINPNNIKSIDILKESAATNVYDSRGENGAILFTLR